MDPDSIQPILWMLLLVVLSAYFSATETAFSSYNRIRMKNMAENGNRRAALVLRLSKQYDRLLSTILVGNNIVNILLTAIATLFFVQLYGEGRGATISTVVSTIVVLIFGEISPKSLAKDYAERFAIATAPLLQGVVWLLYPVNYIFSFWKKLLQLIFKSPDDQTVTEEDLLTIVDEAEQDGSLNEQESELIRRVISFNDREAVDILIPRVDVVGVPADATGDELGRLFDETGYSRLPVYGDTMDKILGIVHYKDYTRHRMENPKPIDIMSAAVFIPPTLKIRLLLKKLQDEKSHIAIVTDEYGGTLGIVTMEDVLEELVGDIWDEHDDVINSISLLPDGTCSVLCSTDLQELMEHFDCKTDCESSTVSGWVMEALERIPVEGDTFTADGLQVTVVRVDKNHPETILVSPADIADAETEE